MLTHKRLTQADSKQIMRILVVTWFLCITLIVCPQSPTRNKCILMYTPLKCNAALGVIIMR